MTAVYGIVLAIATLALIGWMIAHGVARNTDRADRDPEEVFGVPGRRVIAGLVGFGLAGMSAEFASIDISSGWVVVLALAGGGAGALWAGFASDDEGLDERVRPGPLDRDGGPSEPAE